MAEKRKRGQNFSLEEKERLVKFLLDHKNTILNKRTDGTTNEAKLLAWTEVTNSFNASGSIYRSKESLMKIWEKLKSDSKLYHGATRKSLLQTGGGPSVIKTDPVLEIVCTIMGRGCTGILNVNDSDAVNVEEVSLPKVICIEDVADIPGFIEIENKTITEITNKPEETFSAPPIENIIQTPTWSRRRPISSKKDERYEAINSLCTGYNNVNKRKEEVEDLKYNLIKEEFETKKKLNQLQIQAAIKDLEIKDLEIEIKKTVLNQISSGVLQNNIFSNK